jgi:hypothetical protein
MDVPLRSWLDIQMREALYSRQTLVPEFGPVGEENEKGMRSQCLMRSDNPLLSEFMHFCFKTHDRTTGSRNRGGKAFVSGR